MLQIYSNKRLIHEKITNKKENGFRDHWNVNSIIATIFKPKEINILIIPKLLLNW